MTTSINEQFKSLRSIPFASKSSGNGNNVALFSVKQFDNIYGHQFDRRFLLKEMAVILLP